MKKADGDALEAARFVLGQQLKRNRRLIDEINRLNGRLHVLRHENNKLREAKYPQKGTGGPLLKEFIQHMSDRLKNAEMLYFNNDLHGGAERLSKLRFAVSAAMSFAHSEDD